MYLKLFHSIPLKNILKIIILFYVYECFSCMYVYVLCMFDGPEGQKRVLGTQPGTSVRAVNVLYHLLKHLCIYMYIYVYMYICIYVYFVCGGLKENGPLKNGTIGSVDHLLEKVVTGVGLEVSDAQFKRIVCSLLRSLLVYPDVELEAPSPAPCLPALCHAPTITVTD